MNKSVEKVNDIFRTKILKGFPDPSATPVDHTREITNYAPRGIRYSDGTVALFTNGYRLVDIDFRSTRAHWAADVLYELQLITATECVEFKNWVDLETNENLHDFLVENLYAQAEKLGYKVVLK